MPVLWWLQGPSEDLNRPLQDIVRNFEDGIIAQSIARVAMKQLATYKPYKTLGKLFFRSYLEPHSLMSRFANGNILSTLLHRLFAIFVSPPMLGAI